MNYLIKKSGVTLSKGSDIIIKVAAIVGAITVVAGGYAFFINNIYTPKIEVISVDYTNGLAMIKYRGKVIELDGDAVYWLLGDWGVMLGSIHDGNNEVYDRIQLVKKGMVVEYVKRA